MFLQLLQLVKKAQWDVSMDVLEVVQDRAQVLALGDVGTHALVHVKTLVQVVSIHVQDRVRTVAQGRANIRVLNDNSQDSFNYIK